MKQLVAYLLENLILDFQGELTLDMVRDFLRNDDSKEAKQILAKLVKDGGVDDMLIVLADCLVDYIPKAVSPEVVAEQLITYTES